LDYAIAGHSTAPREALISEAVEQLLAMPEESSRRAFLARNPRFRDQSVVSYLASKVPKIAREDVDRALQLAGLASWLAEILDSYYCRARSARATGHALQLKGRLLESLAEYQKALDLFTKLQLESEIGITLSGSLQPLILLGNYEEARLREERARRIFKALGDELGLARLDANLGNILHRQDRFWEALVLYRRAEQSLRKLGTDDDLAILLIHIGVCCISLREFDSALESYHRLRTYSEQHHLPMLTTQADYNIAHLHYLRGEYSRAMELYTETRTCCARVGDAYHAALCDLDQAEIYHHLNSRQECQQLADRALVQFQELGMDYETAKAYTFLGLAACHEGDSRVASEFFAKARELFLLEQNWIWPAILDLYQAIVLYGDSRWPEALETVKAAQNVLSHSALEAKAALAGLLRSLLHLELGDLKASEYWGELVLQRIERSEIKDFRYLAEFVLGRVREGQDDLSAARHHYERAETALKHMPNRSPKLKVPLLKDTGTLYRHLVCVSISLPRPTASRRG
jgi:tetratricopeptide (TPR) repeat protein